jgi:hypothetical protein
MESSSISRTPIEIWQLILQEAIASPLLPLTKEGVLSTDLTENLNIFSTSCEDYRVYRDIVQATIERLRLVCRTWANLLKDSTSYVTLTDLCSHHYPSQQMIKHARRVHLWTNTVCRCQRYIVTELCNFPGNLWTLSWNKEMNDEQFLHSRIPNVKILLLDSLMISTLKFLKPLSNLVALSLHCDPHPDVTWNMKEISIYAPRLTHLHLEYLNEGSRLLVEEFQHNYLRYLSLRIDHESNIRFSYRKTMNWTFPCLETARIHGTVHQESANHITTFISRHLKGLKGLDIGYRIYMTDYSPGSIPSNLWDLSRSHWIRNPLLLYIRRNRIDWKGTRFECVPATRTPCT